MTCVTENLLGEWDAYVLCLSVANLSALCRTTQWVKTPPATIRAHGHISICPASEARVDTRAKSRLSFFAVPAAAIGNVEWHHDSITFLEETDTLAHLFDKTHVLVACGD